MGMDLLVVLATSIAYSYSVVVVILDSVLDNLNFELFFDSGPLLLLFISFGRLLEHIAKVTQGKGFVDNFIYSLPPSLPPSLSLSLSLPPSLSLSLSLSLCLSVSLSLSLSLSLPLPLFPRVKQQMLSRSCYLFKLLMLFWSTWIVTEESPGILTNIHSCSHAFIHTRSHTLIQPYTRTSIHTCVYVQSYTRASIHT